MERNLPDAHQQAGIVPLLLTLEGFGVKVGTQVWQSVRSASQLSQFSGQGRQEPSGSSLKPRTQETQENADPWQFRQGGSQGRHSFSKRSA